MPKRSSSAKFSSKEKASENSSIGFVEEELTVEDKEELEAVAKIAAEEDATEEDVDIATTDSDDEDEENKNPSNNEIGRHEKIRLREMERLKRKKIKEILDSQNAIIDADMNNKGKGRLKYLLKQTAIFAHFANRSQPTVKKTEGRDSYASKVTEEDDGPASTGGTRLLTQPSFTNEWRTLVYELLC